MPPGAAPPGTVDLTFGSGGRAIADVPEWVVETLAVAVAPDGAIVVGAEAEQIFGPTETGPSLGMVVRFTADGALDATFGDGGVVRIAAFDRAASLAIRDDGAILVAGRLVSVDFALDLGVTLLGADGAPDPSFGDGGLVRIDTGAQEDDPTLAVAGDGAIYVAGTRHAERVGLFLARLLPDGAIDPSFGAGGTTLVVDGLRDLHARGVAVLPDGTIVVGAWDHRWASISAFGAVRFTADGALDATFGIGGLAVALDDLSFVEQEELALLPDGRVALGGSVSHGSGSAFASVVLAEDGAVDAVSEVAGGGELHFGFGIAVQRDCGVVLAGLARSPTDVAAVVRLDAGGVVDPGFGDGGITRTSLGEPFAIAEAVTLDAHGDLIVAGEVYGPAMPRRLAVARLAR